MIPIIYREFYDIPRIFYLYYRDKNFLFDCPFSEEIDDYPDYYIIYLMPKLSDSDLIGSWKYLPEKAIKTIGTIPVNKVKFDESRGKSIDASCLDKFE
jgi:hypothetical protein